MQERDLQDYLFDNPDVLFPGQTIQEKAREYQIQGKRIDILFVVDGIRYIVELKKIPIQREHIGQVVEYYGLMKSYLHEANLKMILVSPSIPEYRKVYLEELGIRCVELAQIPENHQEIKRVRERSAKSHKAEQAQSDLESDLPLTARLIYDEITGPATRRVVALTHRIVRDSLEIIRRDYDSYEVMPFRVRAPHAPDIDCSFLGDARHGEMACGLTSTWWAFQFGNAEQMSKNDFPNVSVIGHPAGLAVTINAELLPSQRVMVRRILEDGPTFDCLLREHGSLWCRTWLKIEHQPRFYHWIPLDELEPGSWDSGRLLECVQAKERDFPLLREEWIGRIMESNRNLSPRQTEHMKRTNHALNLAVRLIRQFPVHDALWAAEYQAQIKILNTEITRLKPLIDFFHS